jgi:hypothetical protein
MSTELVKINTVEALAQGGAGVDFGSKLFQLKPATLTVNQGQTQAEGAIPGMLRVVETGEQFKKLTVALLLTPVEARQYYIGKPGELTKTPENLMCFAFQPEKGKPWMPHDNAKMPQALRCSGCSKAMDVSENWAKYNQSGSREDIPQCELFYKAIFIDTVTQCPLRMYIRSGHKDGFEQGMQNLARNIKLLQAKGQNPNIFDFSFDIYAAKKVNKGGQTTFVLKVENKSLHLVTPEEKEKFGELYLNYVNRGVQENTEQDYVKEATKVVDAAIGTPETINAQGEVVI